LLANYLIFQSIFCVKLSKIDLKKIFKAMLIEFSVANYRAVSAKQTLSLVASGGCKDLPDNTFLADGFDKKPLSLLKAAAIYGPNASGKSTLVKALRFMQNCVLKSHSDTQMDEKIDTEPFKLTAQSRAEDSEFEVNFVEGGVRYHYGFRCNRQRFTEEWLFAFPKGRSQAWFQRVVNPQTQKDEYRYSAQFESESRRRGWELDTRPNALFLSKAIQSNSEQLKPVFEWFKNRLRILGVNRQHLRIYTNTQCEDPKIKQRVVDFMVAADISIQGIEIQDKVFSMAELPAELPIELREQIMKDVGSRKEVKFIHQDVETKENLLFELTDESAGTQSLFDFSGPWLNVLDNNRVLVIDEIDNSLHPLMVHHLVSEFHRLSRQAQMIFTTHDTTLLSQSVLRRDQIWLFGRNTEQASQWQPLADFGTRVEDALERRYLNGRYGAIPLLKSMEAHGNG
jgi:uncharacterized protein